MPSTKHHEGEIREDSVQVKRIEPLLSAASSWPLPAAGGAERPALLGRAAPEEASHSKEKPS